MTTIQLINNGQFTTTSGPFSEWSAFPDPAITTLWNGTTLLAANGSGGNIPFPTVSGYTPTPYTAPSSSAPPGNAAFVGFKPTKLGSLQYTLPALIAGVPYTISFAYCNNSGIGGLTGYQALFVILPNSTFVGDSPYNLITWKTFSTTGGWLIRTLTFTADQNTTAGTAKLAIYGGCTNGTVSNGSTTIGSGTIMSPMLIANLSFSYPSTGQRAFPYGGLPVGKSPGTVAAGSDTRISNLDANLFLRPRMERIDFSVSGTLATGTGQGGYGYVPGSANAPVISTIAATVGSLSVPGTTTVFVDVLLNNASVLSAPMQVSTTSVSGPGVTVNPQVVSAAGGGLLTVNIGAVTGGSATNLAVSVWVYFP